MSTWGHTLPPPEARPPRRPGEASATYKLRIKRGGWCLCPSCIAAEPWRGPFKTWRDGKLRRHLDTTVTLL